MLDLTQHFDVHAQKYLQDSSVLLLEHTPNSEFALLLSTGFHDDETDYSGESLQFGGGYKIGILPIDLFVMVAGIRIAMERELREKIVSGIVTCIFVGRQPTLIISKGVKGYGQAVAKTDH